MSHSLHRSSVLSLGCNIGYGYLHRVPRLLSGHGRRTRFPAHASFRTPSEGLTKVGWVQQEKGFHGGVPRCLKRYSAHQVHLSAVIPTDPLPPSAGQPHICSDPTGLATFLFPLPFFFLPLQTKHDGFCSVPVLTIPSSQRVPTSFSPAAALPGHYSGPRHFHTDSPVPQPCPSDAAGVGGNLFLSFGMFFF